MRQSSAHDREAVKEKVLRTLGGDRAFRFNGRATYQVGQIAIHARYYSTDRKRPTFCKFNINPNSLSADYELWICGTAEGYYLLSNSRVSHIYRHLKAHVDHYHPKIENETFTSSERHLSDRMGSNGTSRGVEIGKV